MRLPNLRGTRRVRIGALTHQPRKLLRLRRRKVGSVNDSESPIDPGVPPSGTGCVECLASGGWWFHLRRCAQCGHIGCCDTSPSQHATRHAESARHPVVQSYEPGEDWFWDYAHLEYVDGPMLAAPQHRPLDQPVPGPAGRVPPDWESQLN